MGSYHPSICAAANTTWKCEPCTEKRRVCSYAGPAFAFLPFRPGSAHLTAVRHVDDGVGLLLEEPLAESRQVGRVVRVAAVRLDNGEGEGLTRSEDDFAALVQLNEA